MGSFGFCSRIYYLSCIVIILGKIGYTRLPHLSTLCTPPRTNNMAEDPISTNAVGDGVHASRNKEMKMAQSVMVPDSVGRSNVP